MADEWSKPVKDEEGDWRSETVGAPMGHYHDALLRDGYIGEGMDRQTAIPAHVALRLLAAEASDRLGWVWEWRFANEGNSVRFWVRDPSALNPDGDSLASVWLHRHEPDDPRCYVDVTSADAFLAIHHGAFLAADALREAGQ